MFGKSWDNLGGFSGVQFDNRQRVGHYLTQYRQWGGGVFFAYFAVICSVSQAGSSSLCEVQRFTTHPSTQLPGRKKGTFWSFDTSLGQFRGGILGILCNRLSYGGSFVFFGTRRCNLWGIFNNLLSSKGIFL